MPHNERQTLNAIPRRPRRGLDWLERTATCKHEPCPSEGAALPHTPPTNKVGPRAKVRDAEQTTVFGLRNEMPVEENHKTTTQAGGPIDRLNANDLLRPP